MPRQHQNGDQVRPIDIELGGDDDMPGIAQELTADDIDDVVLDAQLSTGQRREQLMGLLAEIRSRQSSDAMGDMEAILDHLQDAIASLSNPQEGETLFESTGMDPDGRSDDDDPADHVDDDEDEEAARLHDLSLSRRLI